MLMNQTFQRFKQFKRDDGPIVTNNFQTFHSGGGTLNQPSFGKRTQSISIPGKGNVSYYRNGQYNSSFTRKKMSHDHQMNVLRQSYQPNNNANFNRAGTSHEGVRAQLNSNLNFASKNGKPQRPVTVMEYMDSAPVSPAVPYYKDGVDIDIKKICNQSRLSIKAQKVQNKSVQKYMSAMSNYVKPPKVRFDQTDGPVYPNFELPKDQQSPKLGQIGWGISKPGLVTPNPNINDAREKYHINYWDNTKNQKFIKLTGDFTSSHDKRMEVNPEIYHLMNTSAQRMSIKSLDMQQRISKADTANIKSHHTSTGQNTIVSNNSRNQAFGQPKQSFPEVVSYLSNPFQRSQMNDAVRNQTTLITPKMAQGMRFTRGFNSRNGNRHTRAKSIGI